MGEIIKVVDEIVIGDKKFQIELNYPNGDSNQNVIHIQNEKTRIEFLEKDFLQMASCILYAKQQFDIIKRKSDE